MLNVHSPKLANPEHHLLAQSPLSQLIQDWPSTPSNLALSHDSSQHQESSRFKEFRKALSTLTVQKQISRAITQAPQNAGPINSHMLILRSLGLMHELSPDYLNRFMAYIDTLFCLEDAGKAKLQLSKIPAKPKDQ